FFFQAEDGIRDLTVTGVQTCALPIFGLFTVVTTPHFSSDANPERTGKFLKMSPGWASVSVSGGSRDCPFPVFQVIRLLGWSRNSIHFHAASGFLDWEKTPRPSSAMVVAHFWSCGMGVMAHFPLIWGNSVWVVPANHAPASYMATLPCAKNTRPS